MIRSNLASLLEERKLKLEEISDYSQLNIRHEQLFTYAPYYLKVDHINYLPQTDKLEIIFEIKDDKGSTMHPLIYGNYSLNNAEKDLSIMTNFTEAGQFPEVKIKNELLFTILKELSDDFLLDLELEIFNIVVALINLETINSLNFNWPKELYVKQSNL
jgi:hypothetical protein